MYRQEVDYNGLNVHTEFSEKSVDGFKSYWGKRHTFN
jgi:hypothetical protein